MQTKNIVLVCAAVGLLVAGVATKLIPSVIFTGTTGKYWGTVTTQGFFIDEHPQTDANLRIRH